MHPLYTLPLLREPAPGTAMKWRTTIGQPPVTPFSRLQTLLGLHTTRQPNRFERLPDAIIDLIASHLDNPNNFLLSHAVITCAIYRSRLIPSCRQTSQVKVMKYYDNPANRLDRYVPRGPQGALHMASLGIPHQYLINQIQNGWLTIRQAADIVRRGREKIIVWVMTARSRQGFEPFPMGEVFEIWPGISITPSNASGVLETIREKQVQHYIECGVINNIYEVLRLRPDTKRNLKLYQHFTARRTVLSDYLDQEKLTLNDIIKIETDYEHGLKLLMRLQPNLKKWSREQLRDKVLPMTKSDADAITSIAQFDQLLSRPTRNRF